MLDAERAIWEWSGELGPFCVAVAAAFTSSLGELRST
jgi:hypothetical protein